MKFLERANISENAEKGYDFCHRIRVACKNEPYLHGGTLGECVYRVPRFHRLNETTCQFTETTNLIDFLFSTKLTDWVNWTNWLAVLISFRLSLSGANHEGENNYYWHRSGDQRHPSHGPTEEHGTPTRSPISRLTPRSLGEQTLPNTPHCLIGEINGGQVGGEKRIHQCTSITIQFCWMDELTELRKGSHSLGEGE